MSDEGLEAAADSLYYDNMDLEKEVEVLKAENQRLREALLAVSRQIKGPSGDVRISDFGVELLWMAIKGER